MKYVEITRRFVVFDEAALRKYAANFTEAGNDPNEDETEQLIDCVWAVADFGGPHPNSQAESEHGYFLYDEAGAMLEPSTPLAFGS